MASPTEYKMIVYGLPGTYAVGCVPTFDEMTRELIVGPGILRAPLDPEVGNGLEEEFVFPGGSLTLPSGATEVYVGWRRDGPKRAPALIVNMGKGVDTVTYRALHMAYQYGSVTSKVDNSVYMAHILRHFRMSPKEIRQWVATQYGTPPTDMEQFRGADAGVYIQTDYPEALRLSLEREHTAREAKKALKNLLRVPADEWTDQDMRQVVLNIALSDPELEVPAELLQPLP